MFRTENDLRTAYARLGQDQDAHERLARLIGDLADTRVMARRPHARRLRRLAPIAAAAAIVGLAVAIGLSQAGERRPPAAAGGPSPSSDPASPPASATAAGSDPSASSAEILHLWADFPVTAATRPIVLTERSVKDPVSGFSTSAGKVAFAAGNLQLHTTLPDSPPRAGGWPAMSAASAMAALTSGDGTVSAIGDPLDIVGVSLSSTTFSTDRGPLRLPAWAFVFAGVADPAYVLAIPPSDRWPQAGMPTSDPMRMRAKISPDGKQVSLTFVGALPGTGPCEVEYFAETSDSTTAVLMSVRTRPSQVPSSGAGCFAVGHPRTLDVTLPSPIGNRVILSSNGAVVPAD